MALQLRPIAGHFAPVAGIGLHKEVGSIMSNIVSAGISKSRSFSIINDGNGPGIRYETAFRGLLVVKKPAIAGFFDFRPA